MAEGSILYDVAIRSGTIIDGTGNSRYRGDVGIKGDRIATIAAPGALSGAAASEIDAAGRIVSPGFIDVHTHDDNAVLIDPAMTAKISQGVTTVIVGNCGISLSPIGPIDPPPPMNLLGGREAYRFPSLAEYTSAVDEAVPAVNVAALIGHSTLRVGFVEDITRKANAREAERMQKVLAQCLEEGATGFSTGLWYRTNAPADMDEVVALAAVLADKGGVYTTHMRDEHDGVLDSLAETFETAKRAHVPVVISHHKCAGPRNWGRSVDTLAMIEQARSRQEVALDAYPYVAGSTVLEPEMVDPEIRISVSWSTPHPEMAGRDLADIASEWGCSQQDAARRLKPAGGIYFQMDEADMRRILSYPPTMIGSDGLPHDTHPHPRLWGTFPRVLGHFSRDEGLFGLEEAVHKMTGLSAKNFRLAGRGVIETGAHADIVIFDAKTVGDRATFDHPMQPAQGIEHVLVNGVVAWSPGGPGERRGGRFLRGNEES
jgi:N-acyl-D-amino-acid deacylase